MCESFWEEVNAADRPTDVMPVIASANYYLIHVYREDMFFLAVVKDETPPLFAIEFLHRVADTFVDYFGGTDEETIKQHFVTVYQILEETMDSGVPLTTEPNVLKELIRPPTRLARVRKAVTGSSGGPSVPGNSLSTIPWRKAGVKYSSNEFFVDLVEEVDAIIETNGMPATWRVTGKVQANSKLSGMPDLTLIFANPRLLDDVSFHPCVRYAVFESDRVLSFVPPDGEFELMQYTVQQQTQLPLYCKPQITYSDGYANVNVMVGSKPLADDIKVVDVSVTIPFVRSTTSATLSANHGKVVYDELSKTATWTVGKIPQSKVPTLTGSLTLPVGEPIPESNPNVSLSFTFPSYAISGLRVATLNIKDVSYKPFKGIRSLTQAGAFEIRC